MISRTFDEIFDQMHDLYKGEWVHIQVKKDGLKLSNFTTYVRDLKICPLDERTFRKNLGVNRKEKLGSIVISGSATPNSRAMEVTQIPFKLGFDTMVANFLRQNVQIETCGFEFAIRRLTSREIRALSA